ncbi:DUF1090 family protein [Campylobacter canadensis]|uniref:DUF1090 family protein n=1 Tax=Campylobacter canadensis TaxID=449520 RepID=UPI0015516CEB|nr:DUF1090 family protein [Campylobacter canadensis]MBZ7995351.1 DUF1090 family protein [Campylobacter canadensis]MBZ7996323.1 DUF1090 family protein [Campylobacter canadensis]MBZ8000070.1 DUF1090 family protein [Campylobacter canadensis]MBZ8002453.1 DUF1090 family protein [Campylobacter canadensis]MBZ8003155.1 DUF1090 family protein [Campylobacter canadensis]
MKKIFILSMCACAFLQADCNIKLQKLQNELEYAKQYSNTNRINGLNKAIADVKARCNKNPNYEQELNKAKKSLENKKESEVLQVESKLKELDAKKDSMSKSEYKAKKEELKAYKKQIKNEYKIKKEELKNQYK